ncbi:probable Xaa-Pro aminopeptidase GLRG_02280 [Trichoderma asperellum]|uniref:Xaa-Pro aminopeptidase n=1 Tax=Trichoderma asperellum TaxID=101201 RepID=A0A6V8R4A5_TRIAP|nr:probable Xaa-Pro aminopeptidase GLRG_02280 [Trichoderma asperellum]
MEDLDFSFILDDEFDAVAIARRDDFETWKTKKYPAKEHARRVAKELDISDGIIYLPGRATENYEDSDQPPPLRQRRYFFYLTGANFHDCFVTYEIRADTLTLWIPYVEPRQVLWFGSTPDAAKAKQLYDVDDVRYSTQLDKFFESRFTSSTQLFVLHPDQTPTKAKELKFKINDWKLQPAMNNARCIKDEYEIAMIRRANEVSSAGHRKVAEMLLRLSNEREIEAIFQAVTTARGARSQAYPVIAGSGVNASTLHYEDNDQPLKGKELVILDAGCEWNCYASDITRTLPIKGQFSTNGAAVYKIVQQMQEECIAAVKPGIKFYQLHLHAAAVGLKGLHKLGILKGDIVEIAKAGTITAFFPHGLGHHVGLEVHDVPGNLPLMMLVNLGLDGGKRDMISADMLKAMRTYDEELVPSRLKSGKERQVLKPNMIVTVEPGIYFCREYIEGYYLSNPDHAKFIDKDVLESYYSVGGVRIEDDILVTEDGYENLTTAPKGEEMISVINAKGGKQ